MTDSGQALPIRLEINPRARRISLKIDIKLREAVAISPNQKSKTKALEFAQQRISWIENKLSELPQILPLTPNTLVPLRGLGHIILPAQSGRSVTEAYTDKGEPCLYVPGKPEMTPKKVIGFLKARARLEITHYVNQHTKTLGVSYAGIAIKDTKTRWGSCSSRGNLNFSWRLICAPEFVTDYVAAHECAHLLEMNHSSRFWAQVARCIPDAKPAKEWLNRNGRLLHAIGD